MSVGNRVLNAKKELLKENSDGYIYNMRKNPRKYFEYGHNLF